MRHETTTIRPVAILAILTLAAFTATFASAAPFQLANPPAALADRPQIQPPANPPVLAGQAPGNAGQGMQILPGSRPAPPNMQPLVNPFSNLQVLPPGGNGADNHPEPPAAAEPPAESGGGWQPHGGHGWIPWAIQHWRPQGRPNARPYTRPWVSRPSVVVTKPHKQTVVVSGRKPTGRKTFEVVRVTDDYSVILQTADGQRRRVRMLGLKAPLAPDANGDRTRLPRLARQFVDDLMVGARVYLTEDPGKVHRDTDGARLVYLHRVSDGLLLNLELVRAGYTRLATDYQYTKRAQFIAAHRAAREAGHGRWALLGYATN